MNRFPFEDSKYKSLCKTLSSLFNPMTSNICLICKHYKISDEGEKLGCNIPGGKCLLDPDEEKLLDA